MTTDTYKTKPLTEWITGTVTMHFAGATIRRRMTLADARTIQQMNDDKRASDRPDWSDLGWVQFDKPLVCEFDADEDLGWGLKADERRTLKEHGAHPHGVLRTLRDLWVGEGREPSYSGLALYHLSRAALDGTKGDDFAALAKYIEGDKGTRALRSLLESHAAGAAEAKAPQPRARAEDLAVDDTAEPEHASDDPQTPVTDDVPDSETPAAPNTGTDGTEDPQAAGPNEDGPAS